MIKLIIFDLDGVLVDAKEIHYNALNTALKNIDKKYVIGRDEHLSIYDGNPTRTKLKLLSQNKGLPYELHDKVWEDKQNLTIQMINDLEEDKRLIKVLEQLEQDGYVLCCATNSGSSVTASGGGILEAKLVEAPLPFPGTSYGRGIPRSCMIPSYLASSKVWKAVNSGRIVVEFQSGA